MTAVAWAALTVAAVAAAVDWFAVAGRRRRVEYVAKPLAMVALVVVAATVIPVDEGRRWWFVAAGVFSLAGDVLLMLPRDRFVAGLASFLVAHICYIAGLLQLPGELPGAVAGAVVVTVMVATIGRRVLQAVRAGGHAPLFVPVAGYLVVISAMVVVAWAVGPWLAAAGALIFYASDAILAHERFVRPHRWAPTAVMVTYHSGQAALVLSLVRA